MNIVCILCATLDIKAAVSKPERRGDSSSAVNQLVGKLWKVKIFFFFTNDSIKTVDGTQFFLNRVLYCCQDIVIHLEVLMRVNYCSSNYIFKKVVTPSRGQSILK